MKTVSKLEVRGTFGKEWFLPHHPVLNRNKPGKVRHVCNAAAKYNDVCLNDKLLAGPDLLHGLIRTKCRFRQGPLALTADIESMFLQIQFSERDKRCLRCLRGAHVATNNERTCANLRVSSSCFRSKEYTNICLLGSEASSDR